ncbi:hypothetical protein NBRC110019_05240 [Neptunitalea chrysea]|uniref:Uncharacterized protein n=1 Tax=Neptunitalea chrysea TaxID=1647581 RepID=A0A9W6ETA2_9FLAO|nr:hypothetical protein [Neptunitalea chrysea]GLB51485.1 hypothetical protein NBRC110019_05240 [Neptunitalea chrysea]
MKNNLSNEVILQEMRRLLAYSCNDSSIENNHYENLHLVILKKHFNAEDVRIDHLNNVIHVHICLDGGADFFGRKSVVDVEMKYTDINEFLQNCIEGSDQNIFFYKNILNFYSREV